MAAHRFFRSDTVALQVNTVILKKRKISTVYQPILIKQFLNLIIGTPLPHFCPNEQNPLQYMVIS